MTEGDHRGFGGKPGQNSTVLLVNVYESSDAGIGSIVPTLRGFEERRGNTAAAGHVAA